MSLKASRLLCICNKIQFNDMFSFKLQTQLIFLLKNKMHISLKHFGIILRRHTIMLKVMHKCFSDPNNCC